LSASGLHGYETLRTEFDRRFSERIIAWGRYLYRYLEVRADRESEQALIDAGGINALGFRYIGHETASLAGRSASSEPFAVVWRPVRSGNELHGFAARLALSTVRTPAEHRYGFPGSWLSFVVRWFGLLMGPGGTGGDCLPSLAVTRNEGVRG